MKRRVAARRLKERAGASKERSEAQRASKSSSTGRRAENRRWWARKSSRKRQENRSVVSGLLHLPPSASKSPGPLPIDVHRPLQPTPPFSNDDERLTSGKRKIQEEGNEGNETRLWRPLLLSFLPVACVISGSPQRLSRPSTDLFLPRPDLLISSRPSPAAVSVERRTPAGG
jgi:hypothetical protein